MRRSTRGIIAINIALSMSYDPNTGLTCGLLHGYSNAQQAFVCEQVKIFSAIASHPLLLPVLFSAYLRQFLRIERDRLWDRLLRVETQSGQTGAPVLGVTLRRHESDSYNNIILGAMEIIQLASAWESYTEALLLSIDSIQECIGHVKAIIPPERSKTIQITTDILTDRLAFIGHKSKVLLWDLQYINKRGQAQMTAVRSDYLSGLFLLNQPVTFLGLQSHCQKRCRCQPRAVCRLTRDCCRFQAG